MMLRLCFALVALALLPLSASAQNETGKRFALLVGVTAYEHADLSELKYAQNDADRLGEVFREAGYDEVVLLTTRHGKADKNLAPTAANIRAQLTRLSDKVKRDDLLLIALSGHGVRLTVKDEQAEKETDESFFCPADARPRNGVTMKRLRETLIPLGELFTELDASGAGVRLLLVDACRNDVANSRGKNIDVDNLPRTKKGTAVLFSCKGGERAFETEKYQHGVFFHHVIAGLSGEAKDKRGRITWASLVEHVVEKVSEEVPTLIGGGAKQTPHEIKNMEGLSPRMLPEKPSETQRLFLDGIDACVGSKKMDYTRAVQSFRDAALKGHPVAFAMWGWLQSMGQGIEQNEAEGVKKIAAVLPRLQLRAGQGDSHAQTVLGWLYESGRAVEKDEKQAVAWFRKAAARENVLGQFSLGYALAAGQGVKQDDKQAVNWYRKAADKGHALAMNNLGWMYAIGQGVERDDKEAVTLYRKAAERGIHLAMNNLGWMYENGRGVNQDLAEARQWYKQAAEFGHAEAKKSLERLADKG